MPNSRIFAFIVSQEHLLITTCFQYESLQPIGRKGYERTNQDPQGHRAKRRPQKELEHRLAFGGSPQGGGLDRSGDEIDTPL